MIEYIYIYRNFGNLISVLFWLIRIDVCKVWIQDVRDYSTVV